MMARNRSEDTKPEMILRRGLHAAGFRFRLNVPGLQGKPDIVLPKHRSVIFVHGCFWHAHVGCNNFQIPKSRPEFWIAKIKTNGDRDHRAMAALCDAGWRVLVVWQCATRSICMGNLVRTVAAWLKGTETSAEMGVNSLACPREFKPRIVRKQEIRI